MAATVVPLEGAAGIAFNSTGGAAGGAAGESIPFEVDPFLRERLLNGWDQIGLTLRHEDAIAAFERKRG